MFESIMYSCIKKYCVYIILYCVLQTPKVGVANPKISPRAYARELFTIPEPHHFKYTCSAPDMTIFMLTTDDR